MERWMCEEGRRRATRFRGIQGIKKSSFKEKTGEGGSFSEELGNGWRIKRD